MTSLPANMSIISLRSFGGALMDLALSCFTEMKWYQPDFNGKQAHFPLILYFTFDVYPHHSINQIQVTVNPCPEPSLKRWGSAIMPSLWKCNSLSHSWVDNSTQPHTNTFFTFFCHHIWYTFHVWSSPSSSNTASISTCAKPFPFNISAQHNGQIAISKWPLSLQFPTPPLPSTYHIDEN